MYRYSAKIRLGGSVTNEVQKSNLSAAEITILRRLHGNDAVSQVEEGVNDNVSHEEERSRLQVTYDRALLKVQPPTTFEQLFGHSHQPLPVRLMGFGAKPVDAPAPEAPVPSPKAKTAKAAAVKLKDIAS